MGALVVFDNIVFDAWLNNKSQEILSKVDRERITTEEMLILILKAQTNHFHHMDLEFREEFKKIHNELDSMKYETHDEFKSVYQQIHERFREVDVRFEKIDQRFEKIEKKMDDRFDRQNRFLMWQTGLFAALMAGIYLKLFLG